MVNQTMVKKFGFPETDAPKRATGNVRGGNFHPVLIFAISHLLFRC
jgi:hypothetical protein